MTDLIGTVALLGLVLVLIHWRAVGEARAVDAARDRARAEQGRYYRPDLWVIDQPDDEAVTVRRDRP